MGSVTLVKGSDDVLREQATSELVNRLVGDGDRSLVVDERAGADYELAAVVDAASTMPFLTDHRVVVARNLGRFGNADALRPLLDHLAAPLDTTHLVLVWERSPEAGSRLGGLPPTLTKAVKAAGGLVVEVDPPAKGRESWIVTQMAQHEVTLDRAAATLVAEQLGEDGGAVVELAERLAGVHGAGSGLRSRADRRGDPTSTASSLRGAAEEPVRRDQVLSPRPLSVDDVRPWLGEAGGVPPWALTDAIDKGRSTQALEVLHRMLHGGDRHPLQIMASLHGHYARMLRLDGTGARTDAEAAQALGMRGSTFPAQKARTQLAALGSAGVQRAIGLLADADLALRGAQAWPDELVMEVLVARLARAPRGRARR